MLNAQASILYHQYSVYILYVIERSKMQRCKMPKAAMKSNCVDNTSEHEFQADSNLSNESSSDDKVVL